MAERANLGPAAERPPSEERLETSESWEARVVVDPWAESQVLRGGELIFGAGNGV